METIIILIVGFFALCFLYGAIGFLMGKFPVLIWILAFAGGVTAWILSSHIWVGLIVGFIVMGILLHAQSLGDKCAHCGSYDTEVTEKGNGYKIWMCNKCHNVTVSHNKR